jgi:hypothetical protein
VPIFCLQSKWPKPRLQATTGRWWHLPRHDTGNPDALGFVNQQAAEEFGSAADQAEAFQKLVAYSGLYRIESPDRFVTAIDVAWFEPWLGSEQARKCQG